MPDGVWKSLYRCICFLRGNVLLFRVLFWQKLQQDNAFFLPLKPSYCILRSMKKAFKLCAGFRGLEGKPFFLKFVTWIYYI